MDIYATRSVSDAAVVSFKRSTGFALDRRMFPAKLDSEPDVEVRFVTVVAPAANVPVVERFSFPNEIAPLESVIDPEARDRVPTEREDVAVSEEAVREPVKYPSPSTERRDEGVVVPMPTLPVFFIVTLAVGV